MKNSLEKRKEIFINNCKKIHGEKFDYSNVEYLNKNSKVVIICKKHNETFSISSNQHLSNKNGGCKKCEKEQRDIINEQNRQKNEQEFIRKAKLVHGDKYDYSNLNYINNGENVNIRCDKHGNFLQLPSNHLKSGCKKCYIENMRLNTEEFIKRAKLVHGNLYDYSKTVYVKSNENVLIVCKKHGNFYQLPFNHLTGAICKQCSLEDAAKRYAFTNKEFIEKSKNVYGENKFDYSQVNYINGRIDVNLKCIEHNEWFSQNPRHHLEGFRGCKKCETKNRSENSIFRHDTEKFIENAKKVHGDRYDYSKVEYFNSSTMVEIVCKKHGPFLQLPSNHLSGVNCPSCKMTIGEIRIEKYLKEKNIKFNPQHRFKNCRGKKLPLRFDFYLPDYDICLEYDGIQHFQPVSFNDNGKNSEEIAKQNFESTKRNDYIKDQYCINNNIRLIRIPYTSYNDIESILDSELFNDSVTFNISLHNINNKIVEADI